jgi:hypothetical protein
MCQTPQVWQGCSAVDVIVMPACRLVGAQAVLQHWRARGKILVADLSSACYLREAGGAATRCAGRHQLRRELMLVHGVTAASHRLAADWGDLGNVHVLPTFLEPEAYQLPVLHDPEEVVIGWRGGRTHLDAFHHSGVAEALQAVCQARPRLKILLCTNDARLRGMLDLPAGQVVWHPWQPYPQWLFVLSLLDIGIAPLYGDYDQRRGREQVLDYMAQRIPWAASDGPVFGALSSHGWLVHNSPQAWERMLLDMIDHIQEHRQEAQRDPYLYAVSQGVDENVEQITDTYATIAAQNQSLL